MPAAWLDGPIMPEVSEQSQIVSSSWLVTRAAGDKKYFSHVPKPRLSYEVIGPSQQYGMLSTIIDMPPIPHYRGHHIARISIQLDLKYFLLLDSISTPNSGGTPARPWYVA